MGLLEGWLHRCRRAERSYSMLEVRRGGCEEIALVQGKEQRLHFAGAAMKRYPTSKVRETQENWKRSVLIPIPKKGNAKECSNYRTIALISHSSNAQNSSSQASAIGKP